MVSIVSADDKAKFYADKSHYHQNQDVKLTLKNTEKKSIFVPCDGKIAIKDTKTGDKVATLSWNLEGYGCDVQGPQKGFITINGAPTDNINGGLYELKHDKKITKEWNHDDRDHVDNGKYKAYTEYLDHDFHRTEVHTDTFELKK
jgi:hypothetical protein